MAISSPLRLLPAGILAALALAAPNAHAQALAEEPSPSKTGGVSADSTSAATQTQTPTPTPTPTTLPNQPIIAADVPHGPLIAVTARRYGLPVALLTALVWQESGFNERARSRAGARGLTQLMPGTARQLGVRKVYDPAQNLDGGARYLRAQLIRFRGDKRLALAAYNAGPGAVAKHKGIPPYRETRKYVRNILAIEQQLLAAGVK